MSTKKPDHFFIVGGQRCGTTFLCSVLDEHPQVCMAKPIVPEPKFFLDNTFLRGLDYYDRDYFREKNDGTLWLGEKSTSYHEYEHVAQRIRLTLPGATILFILRHPTFRAISNYFFSRKNGLETRSLEDVFLNNVPAPIPPLGLSTNPFDYFIRGEYLKYLRMYEKYFDRDHIIVLTYETFVGNLNEIQKLYARLGIDSNVEPPSLNRKINSSDATSAVNKEIIGRLHRYYAPYIAGLEALLGRSLEEWRV
jgi:hypothetical protein